jgi:Ser/Thr protein kinase RdoA (MazF antagonist)
MEREEREEQRAFMRHLSGRRDPSPLPSENASDQELKRAALLNGNRVPREGNVPARPVDKTLEQRRFLSRLMGYYEWG